MGIYKNILSLLLGFFIGFVPMKINYNRLEKTTITSLLQTEKCINRWKETTTNLKECISQLNDCASVLNDQDVDPEILNWVLQNSDHKIPIYFLKQVIQEAKKYPNYKLILAIIKEESNFNPFVISKKGAVGLVQVMPNIWLRELKENGIVSDKRQLFNYKKNIAACNYILEKYKNQFGDLDMVLLRYSGNANKYSFRVKANLIELGEG